MAESTEGVMSMDKKESLLKQKAEAEKEARQYENQVKILLNKQRDAERTARNHRIKESIGNEFRTGL